MRTKLVIAVAAVSLLPRITVAQVRLESVRWISGCWESVSPTRRIVERWQASGEELTGDSRTVAGSREVEAERLRIFSRSGTLVYDAHPSGQTGAEFLAREVAGDSVVFSNPEHDFPQRIVYKRVGADSLIARIEGDRAGRRQAVTFAYRRLDCAGGSG